MSCGLPHALFFIASACRTAAGQCPPKWLAHCPACPADCPTPWFLQQAVAGQLQDGVLQSVLNTVLRVLRIVLRLVFYSKRLQDSCRTVCCRVSWALSCVICGLPHSLVFTASVCRTAAGRGPAACLGQWPAGCPAIVLQGKSMKNGCRTESCGVSCGLSGMPRASFFSADACRTATRWRPAEAQPPPQRQAQAQLRC